MTKFNLLKFEHSNLNRRSRELKSKQNYKDVKNKNWTKLKKYWFKKKIPKPDVKKRTAKNKSKTHFKWLNLE